MAHTTYAPAPQTPTPASSPGHHPSRRTVLGWVMLGLGVAAAGLLILLTTSSGPSSQPDTTPAPNSSLLDIPRTPEIAERWLAHHSDVLGAGTATTGWPAGVPHSADAAERWFAQQRYAGWPVGVPQSADSAERFYARQQATKPAPGRYAGWPEGVPQSADAAERLLAQQR